MSWLAAVINSWVMGAGVSASGDRAGGLLAEEVSSYGYLCLPRRQDLKPMTESGSVSSCLP